MAGRGARRRTSGRAAWRAPSRSSRGGAVEGGRRAVQAPSPDRPSRRARRSERGADWRERGRSGLCARAPAARATSRRWRASASRRPGTPQRAAAGTPERRFPGRKYAPLSDRHRPWRAGRAVARRVLRPRPQRPWCGGGPAGRRERLGERRQRSRTRRPLLLAPGGVLPVHSRGPLGPTPRRRARLGGQVSGMRTAGAAAAWRVRGSPASRCSRGALACGQAEAPANDDPYE